MLMRIVDYGSSYVKVSSTGFWLTFGISTAIVIAFYLLRSIGLFVMGKKAEIKYSYIAFIPFAWVYLLGMLCKRVFFFGYPIKKFGLVLLISYCIVSAIDITYYVIVYFPLVAYFLSGGGVYIGTPLDTTYGKYLLDTRFYIETNKIIYPYSDLGAIINFLNVLYVFSNIFDIINTVLMITAYFTLFRNYWPQHFMMASIFCIFGFFPVFVFAVRNNKPMSYAEYLRSRFGYYNPYANTDPNDNAGADNRTGGQQGNPFGEFDKNRSQNKPSDDPFDEFKDDNK